MRFEEYWEKCDDTADYPGAGTSDWMAISYTALGLAGEFGEIANQVKKIIRDDNGGVRPSRYDKLVDELGDGMWYLVRFMKEMHIDPEHVMRHNVKKLAARKASGTLGGDGDSRERLRRLGEKLTEVGLGAELFERSTAATKAAQEAEERKHRARALGLPPEVVERVRFSEADIQRLQVEGLRVGDDGKLQVPDWVNQRRGDVAKALTDVWSKNDIDAGLATASGDDPTDLTDDEVDELVTKAYNNGYEDAKKKYGTPEDVTEAYNRGYANAQDRYAPQPPPVFPEKEGS